MPGDTLNLTVNLTVDFFCKVVYCIHHAWFKFYEMLQICLEFEISQNVLS